MPGAPILRRQRAGALFPGESAADDRLYFQDRGALHRLQLNLDEYARALCDWKGLFYWQLLYAEHIAALRDNPNFLRL